MIENRPSLEKNFEDGFDMGREHFAYIIRKGSENNVQNVKLYVFPFADHVSCVKIEYNEPKTNLYSEQRKQTDLYPMQSKFSVSMNIIPYNKDQEYMERIQETIKKMHQEPAGPYAIGEIRWLYKESSSSHKMMTFMEGATTKRGDACVSKIPRELHEDVVRAIYDHVKQSDRVVQRCDLDSVIYNIKTKYNSCIKSSGINTGCICARCSKIIQ
jgi:hypothetical protein